MATSIKNKEKKWPTLIENKEELKKNLQKLADVWFSGKFNTNTASLKVKEYLIERIHRGMCFIAYKVVGEWHFIPSRFVGYKERIQDFIWLLNENQKESGMKMKNDEGKDPNSLDNVKVDGRDTNRSITEILKKFITKDKDEVSWKKWEEEYKKYCKKLQIKPCDYERKYWIFDEEIVPSKDF